MDYMQAASPVSMGAAGIVLLLLKYIFYEVGF